MEQKKQSRSEKQHYLQGVIRNLSLQRLTDQEITDYLHEKGTDISRPRVNAIKNEIERSAEGWYIELKSSRYKFLAMYKERLDSLLSYQKTLNDIVTTTKKEENKIRAIAALQSIEADIFNIYKQLPDIRIEEVNNNDNQDNNDQKDDPQLVPVPTMDDVWGSEPTPTPTPTSSSINGDAIPAIETTTMVNTATTTSSPSPNSSSTSKEEKEKEDDYVWKL